MCTYLGASIELTPDDVSADFIERAKIVYLEGYLFDPSEARRAFAKAAGLARASERLIAITLSDSFVVERHRNELMAFIETQVDIVLANEAELAALFQTDDFDAAAQALSERTRIAAVTRGVAGSVVIAGEARNIIPAYPVHKVVDTTGAGDQYAAGFLLGLAQGRPLDLCGRLGSLAAAEVISHYGPRPQVNLRDLAAKEGLI
jgi:sugar/nucleoside kinase (ribokinase family)